jgi:hypothetical protein
MTNATHDGELVERAPRWFDAIPATEQSWKCWRKALPARHRRDNNPLHGKIESRVDRLIEDADRLRLSITPTTKHFDAMWAAFRRYHGSREHAALARRLRYLVWRAAALTVICRRDRFQDEVDAMEARDLLAATMADIRPDITADGWCRDGGNFWQIWITPDRDGEMKPDPLSEYAVMTLLITKRAYS